jgi:hypothetical protein
MNDRYGSAVLGQQVVSELRVAEPDLAASRRDERLLGEGQEWTS